MYRLSSIEEFVSFRRNIVDVQASKISTLVVCAGTGGQASGSNSIIRIIKKYILENDLEEKIALRITGCQGFCELDPFILVKPEDNLYARLKMEDVPGIIDAVLKGEIIEQLLYRESEHHQCQHNKEELPFFKNQNRLILGNNEKLDPIRIFDYIKQGGYSVLDKVLQDNNPDIIIDVVKKSGLRGRGGAGFPTGKKWEFAHSAKSIDGQKFLICNADEGDPGAYMDRSLLEGNPHAIIEGMIIGGIAIGATQGIIYVRSEYPLAIKHATIAIRQATEMGLLGENILGTDINFTIEIVKGAGAFVCGEETALIRSIQGLMGEPKQRPPYPVQKGLHGRPTCINNVETLANVPVIFSMGAEEYAEIGVPGNSGTKIFSLVGKIKNTGLVEVPMGTTISEIVNDIGGGSSSGKSIKAVQTGGPSGGCIPAKLFNLPIDYDSLAEAGSIMGSGGMIVMDEGTCMVDIAKYYMGFLKDESCGKCYTCRKGTQRMWEILNDITNGKGTMEHLDLLEELANVVKDTTMCGLGQTASNPVLSTLKYFRDEYLEHIINKSCPAGACKNLVGAPCHNACPIGTEAWRYVAHIARGELEDAYKVIRETNPFPSVCARVCDHKCEQNCRLGTTGVEPVAIRSLKRYITDNVDPSIYAPIVPGLDDNPPEIAIIGSGPAGLTAAHMLSLKGYKSTVFEAEPQPGGMLMNCIPSYRLPRKTLKREIESIINDNIILECDKRLGKDITVESLKEEGYKAIFLAIGAQKGRRLYLEDEDTGGVYPSIEFLKAFNLNGECWAKGRVGVIGGGNSAIDAARTALRQEGVEKVTVIYRRTEQEMPAFDEEIEACIEEGIDLMTLTTPTRILSHKGKIAGIECVKNGLGDIDSSGRRRPVPIKNSEFTIPLDTLIIAISEQPDTDSIDPSELGDLKINKNGTLSVNLDTLQTNIEGVFAGGDVVTGPNTVVDAIAAGSKVARVIEKYLKNESVIEPKQPSLPRIYLEPWQITAEEQEDMSRRHPQKLASDERARSFEEVEKALDEADARREARRCLRCDLEFTSSEENVVEIINPEKVQA